MLSNEVGRLVIQMEPFSGEAIAETLREIELLHINSHFVYMMFLKITMISWVHGMQFKYLTIISFTYFYPLLHSQGSGHWIPLRLWADPTRYDSIHSPAVQNTLYRICLLLCVYWWHLVEPVAAAAIAPFNCPFLVWKGLEISQVNKDINVPQNNRDSAKLCPAHPSKENIGLPLTCIARQYLVVILVC